ncbi:type 2 lanthipeptide synthetase LanM family protein [Dactylosporangium sp. CA-233914]|uniref:type 2 lanthipeptide synthetase LanM family protein n=1 Tax=Dactylosporangium sp. CA-233914 TaxID=3239934 RepID=UPI003D8E355D
MATPDIATKGRKTGADDVLDSPAWWGALTRAERTRAPVPRTEAAGERGSRRLAAWLGGRAVTGGLTPDLSRWHEPGLGEDDLRMLLGEAPDSIRARLPLPAEWMQSLARAWSAGPSERCQTRSPDEQHAAHLGPSAGLLALVHPLTSWYRRRLQRELNRLVREFGHHDEVPESHPLLRTNDEVLLQMTARVLIQHLNRASRAGALAGDTPASRFADFVRQLREPAYAMRILSAHPTLARQLVEELERWVTVRRELAARLLSDLPALRGEFGLAAASLNDVVGLHAGAGDTHRGGRSVAILTFDGGGRVVYKPRGLAVESHFYALVDWLNAKGLAHPLRRLAVLDRGEYGWVEFVAADSCADDRAVRRFYWRQGAYLGLLYLLRGSDIHLENVIAAGEFPVIVDLEALFQQTPPTVRDRPVPVPREAPALADESVLAVGLLPRRALSLDSDTVLATDMSGMAGREGELTPIKVPHWQNSGTDQMRLIRSRIEMPGAQNLPKVNDVAVDPAAYGADLISGFESCYRLLLANRDELAATDGPIAAFAADEIRVIVLPTMTYARVLQESWHPAVLADALDRECLFEILATLHPDLRANLLVATSEIQQLAGGDIPMFRTRPDSRDLYDDRGVVARDYFTRSGLDLVRDRIVALGAADLRRQRWTVSASLAALQIDGVRRDARPLGRDLPNVEIDRPLAVRAAVRIGDQLLRTVVSSAPDRPMWLTLALVGDRYWSVVPTAFDGFGGLSGIAVFLGHLGERSGQPRFRSAAESIAAMLAEHIDDLLGWSEADRNMLRVSGYGELGAYVYALTHLGVLWRSEPLLAQAHRLVPELTRRFADERFLDVVSGTAGAALALRALHCVDRSEQTLASLCAAGDRLLATATPVESGLAWPPPLAARSPLLGFSHGVAGIAYALAEIARATGERRFLEAAEKAVRYEHRRYDASAGNWPDHRTDTPEGVFMNAWCHGAAGIGLARAGMLRSLDIREVRADLDAAVAAVRRDLLREAGITGIGNDSLCHGDLGLAETLLSAGLATGDNTLVSLARRVARAVAHDVLSGQERCGVPQGLHVPGLLMGSAGIGYELLRAADPQATPNVLLLEPPTAVSPSAGTAPAASADRVAAEEVPCPAYQ